MEYFKLIILLVIMSQGVFAGDKTSAATKNDPYNLEMKKLKSDFQTREKEIAVYYEKQFRILKENQKKDIEELNANYNHEQQLIRDKYFPDEKKDSLKSLKDQKKIEHSDKKAKNTGSKKSAQTKQVSKKKKLSQKPVKPKY